MKQILSFLIAFFCLACSENGKEEIFENPYIPVRNLEIPKHASQGDTIRITGQFEESYDVAVVRNGATDKIECSVLSVDAVSLWVVLPADCESGFYAVILSNNGEDFKVGGINISGGVYEDTDFELYVLRGATMDIHEASVSKQLISESALPESAVKDLDFSGYVVALPSGMLYYTSYGMYVVDGWIKEIHNIGAYNMQTKERITPISVDNLFVIGTINNEFYIIKSDSEYKTYTLLKWTHLGEEVVTQFDFSALGGARILSLDQKFHYYAKENVILISGNMGKGDSMAQSAFAIDLDSGQIYQVGNNSNYRYAFVPAGEKLYCFATLLDDGDIVKSVVMEIQDVRNWSMAGSGATMVAELPGMAFDMPVYSPVNNMIYGVNDAETFGAILTFNPETNSFEGKRWISPGVGGYFYTDFRE